MKRLKNYGLWSSLFIGLVPLLAQAFGYELPGEYDAIINSILGILVTAGLLNNPSQGNGFKDNKNPSN
jgi:uncharacterized membrane protein